MIIRLSLGSSSGKALLLGGGNRICIALGVTLEESTSPIHVNPAGGSTRKV